MSGGGGTQTVGFRYYMGLHLIWCMGPVDGFLQLVAGDRVAWAGERYTATTTTVGGKTTTTYTKTSTAPMTASGQLWIQSPDLFGGEEKEGGLQGVLDVMMGEAGQAPNAYLGAIQTGPQPGYRGLLGTVFRQGLIGCNNPYIKAWSGQVRRILKGWQSDAPWYSTKAAIDVGGGLLAANPAHIAYECLTNAEWGMGYSPGVINDASFRAAADTFHAEGLGLCMAWLRQDTIESFVQIVMDHAGCNLVQNRRTGLFELRPIRSDYDVDDLLQLTPANVLTLDSYQRPAVPDAVNELTIKYVDAATGEDGAITVQNLANIASQGGVVSATQQYPGVPTSALAQRLGMRDLRARSTPLARVRLQANRIAWGVLPGDVVRLDWPKLGLSGLVLRVLQVSPGTLTDGAITIEAVEDVFGLPAATYVGQQGSGWTNPVSAPTAALARIVREATRYELAREMTAAELAAVPSDAGYVLTAAVRPAGDAQDYALMTKGDGESYVERARGAWAPGGQLLAALTPSATSATLIASRDLDLAEVGDLAQIDAEVVRIDALNPSTGAVTIGRGVLGTVAAAHSAGAWLVFIGGYSGTDGVQRLDGETVSAKLLTRTGRGQLALADAPADSVTCDARAARPYPPGRLRINGQAYPASLSALPIAVSWAHRDRLAQNLEGDESASIGPEAGTSYSARMVNDATGAVVASATSLTGTSWSVSSAPTGGRYRVELWSVRGGLDSFQRHAWAFDLSGTIDVTAPGGDMAVAVTLQAGGASGGGWLSSGAQLRLLQPDGSTLYAIDAGQVLPDTSTQGRLYSSTDGGATWAIAYTGASMPAPLSGIWSDDAYIGTTRISVGNNVDAAAYTVTRATAPSTFTTGAGPTISGATIVAGGIGSDGSVAYIVGRLNDTSAIGPMYLYSSTDGSTWSLAGQITRDPSDTAPTGGRAGLTAEWFVPQPTSSLYRAHCDLRRIGSRWYLLGAHSIWATDAAVPLTGWRRMQLGLADESTSSPPKIAGLEVIGSALVAWSATAGGNVVSVSTDAGASWTPVRPAILDTFEELRGGWVLGGELHVLAAGSGGYTDIISTSTPAGAWTRTTATGLSAVMSGPYVSGGAAICTDGSPSLRILRSTTGQVFSEVSLP